MILGKHKKTHSENLICHFEFNQRTSVLTIGGFSWYPGGAVLIVELAKSLYEGHSHEFSL